MVSLFQFFDYKEIRSKTGPNNILLVRVGREVGFSFFPEVGSAIAVMDDRTLLVTVSGDEVAGTFEVMRKNADFTQLGPGCYKRPDAVFKYESKDGGWNEISAT